MAINYKKVLFSALLIFLSYFLLVFLVFDIEGTITSTVMSLLGTTLESTRMVIDAVVSFILLLSYFSLLMLFKSIHYPSVVLITGFLMFLHWGFDVDFLIDGACPYHPVWFETNMALNDIIVAILCVVAYKRIRNSGTDHV